MFFRITEGTKVAMVKLVESLRANKFVFFDAQMMNPHLERFGAYRIDDEEYLILLEKCLQSNRSLT